MTVTRRFIGGSHPRSKHSSDLAGAMKELRFFRRSTVGATPSAGDSGPSRMFGYALRSAASTNSSQPAGALTASDTLGAPAPMRW